MEEHFDRFGVDLDLDKLLDHSDTFSDPSLEDPSGERFDQIGCNLDLDKFLKQAVMFRELSLEDPLEESFAQFEFDLDLDMIHEQAKALLDPTPKMRIENGEEEKDEQIEPPPIPNWSNEKEVSIEADADQTEFVAFLFQRSIARSSAHLHSIVPATTIIHKT